MTLRNTIPLALAALLISVAALPPASAVDGTSWNGSIPANGDPVSVTLERGHYAVTASGEYQYGFTSTAFADASRVFGADHPDCTEWPGQYLAMDGQNPWGPDCHANHVYATAYDCYTPSCIVTFRILDSVYDDNSGSLQVSIVPDTTPLVGRDVELTPSTPISTGVPPAASLVTYDNANNQVCVDVVAASQATRLGCVARPLLGAADALIPRGRVDVLPEGPLATVPGAHLLVRADANYNPALFLANTVDAAGVVVIAPFNPNDPQPFLSDADGTSLVVRVTLTEDGQTAYTQALTVPYLGQVLAAGAFGQPPLL